MIRKDHAIISLYYPQRYFNCCRLLTHYLGAGCGSFMELGKVSNLNHLVGYTPNLLILSPNIPSGSKLFHRAIESGIALELNQRE